MSFITEPIAELINRAAADIIVRIEKISRAKSKIPSRETSGTRRHKEIREIF
jgi:hypothetical protein